MDGLAKAVADLEIAKIKSGLTLEVVDSKALLLECLNDVGPCSPRLAMDMEGHNLGSYKGSISILQLYREGGKTIWLVDIGTLGREAFETPSGDDALTLAQILERPQTKLIFDVRNDARALWRLFELRLGGVYDLQLLEQATRSARGGDARVLGGLAIALKSRVRLPSDWDAIRTEGKELYASKKGASGSIWDVRPLHPTLIKYAAQDVDLLFPLHEALEDELPRSRKDDEISRVIKKSTGRCQV